MSLSLLITPAHIERERKCTEMHVTVEHHYSTNIYCFRDLSKKLSVKRFLSEGISVRVGTGVSLVSEKIKGVAYVCDILGGKRDFSTAARCVKRVGRYPHTRNMADEMAHDDLTGLDGCSEMCGTPCQIGLEKVVWLDPDFEQEIHQLTDDLGRVVDTAKQNGLAPQRDASIGQPGAGQG